MHQLLIRPERQGEAEAVRRVHDAAFEQAEEGEIVDRLRRALDPDRGDLWISLVAEHGGESIVGHILFTEVTIRTAGAAGKVIGRAAGLAPMAVIPELQRRGIGSRLVEEGLAACREHGQELVVVLGHPGYYPRFGFVPASSLRLDCIFEVPPEAFLALELVPGAAAGRAGTVHYRPEFGPG